VTGGLPIGDTAARLGGDEFAVLLEDVDAERALGVAEQVKALLRVPFALDGKELVVGASVGIALSDGQTSVDELLRNADLAMYRAKQRGKNRCEMYEADMYEAVVERLGLEAELRRAVERGGFTLLYQPTVELATGLIVGCEALVRWQHPERGTIPPLQFIPLAEETGLIVPLGHWVLRQACDQAHRWRREHPALRGLMVSVNLSARQLQHPGLLADVRAALQAARLEPGGLVLEITESVLMQDGSCPSGGSKG
jgi:predicted signal transduction protein with EAL and GGDEF domain